MRGRHGFIINHNHIRVLSVRIIYNRCFQRIIRAHGVLAGGLAEGKDLLDLGVVGNWLVEELDVLWVSLIQGGK
jgi:hypothetical protein